MKAKTIFQAMLLASIIPASSIMVANDNVKYRIVMKRISLFIITIFVGANMVYAQYQKTFRIDIDRSTFEYSHLEDGSVLIQSPEYEHFLEDWNAPAIPHRLLSILLPDQEDFSNLTYKIGPTEIEEGIRLAQNPDLAPTTITNQPAASPIYNVTLEETSTVDGYRLVSLLLPAFSYNAEEQVITWMSYVDVTIETTPHSEAYTHKGTMDELIKSLIINPEDFGKNKDNWTPLTTNVDGTFTDVPGIKFTSSTLLCTSPVAVKLEVYTMDAVKVGETAFANGEAIVKVNKVPATYLYVVTYPDGRRESGKTVIGD